MMKFASSVFLFLLTSSHTAYAQAPSEISLNVASFPSPPYNILQDDGTYSGLYPDLAAKLIEYAAADGTTLTFTDSGVDLTGVSYNDALSLVANDCNATAVNTSQCGSVDLLLGDYFFRPDRVIRTNYLGPILSTQLTGIRLVDGKFQTLEAANADGGKICQPQGSAVTTIVANKFPSATMVPCTAYEGCIAALKDGSCDVYPDDQLPLRASANADDQLVLTGDGFNGEFIGPVIVKGLPEEYYSYMNRWMYMALADGELDALAVKYFGSANAGQSCETCPDCSGSTGNKPGSGVPVMNAVFSAVGPAVGFMLA